MLRSVAANEHHVDTDAIDVFGFWLYLMTDCVLFASLFATFVVLHWPGSPGPQLKNYLDLSDVLIETFFLLASNFTFGLASIHLYAQRMHKVQAWLAASFLLGAGFVYMEVAEFIRLAQAGFRWDVSAQASSFFTLVGTHGFHVSCGLLWILVMMIQLPLLKNAYPIARRRMAYLGMFWNFLELVWIFVFTIVYLTGAV
jgi:cytochrome o ubiquinol oxidase subunit 3